MTFGITPQGFKLKRLPDIQDETEKAWLGKFGEGFDLDPRTPAGQIKGILDERVSLIWELIQALYFSQYPSSAEGVPLDLAVQLVGITREQSTPSTVNSGVGYGVLGTIIPSGTEIAVSGNPNSKFTTDSDAEIVNAALNEIQNLFFEDIPDAGNYTLSFLGVVSAAILFSDNAAAIQAKLEAISSIGAGNVQVSGSVNKNEVQDLTFSAVPDAGQFRIEYDGFQTDLIDFNDTNLVIQAELELLANIGSGNIFVSGNFASGFTFTFVGDLANQDVSLMTIVDNTLEESSNPVTPALVATQEGSAGIMIEFIGTLGNLPQESLVIVSNTLTKSAVPVDFEVLEEQAGSKPYTDPIDLTCTEVGPTTANAGSLTVINTPVVGLEDFNNLSDAVVGRNTETDAELKQRQVQEVETAGSATPNAIRADVLRVSGVTACVVFINNSDITINGVPSKSVDIVVENGDEDDIAEAIFNTVAGGIGFAGDITKQVLDSQGFLQPVKFSRPDPVDIWVEVDLTVIPGVFQIQNNVGINAVKAAILEYGASVLIGQDVVVYGSAPSLGCSFDEIQGISRYEIRVGIAANPTLDDNIDIQPREIAKFDSSRIKVVLS